MPATPDQLERQIAMTRHELATTLSELEARAKPSAIIRRNRPRIAMIGMGALGMLVALFVVKASVQRVLR